MANMSVVLKLGGFFLAQGPILSSECVHTFPVGRSEIDSSTYVTIFASQNPGTDIQVCVYLRSACEASSPTPARVRAAHLHRENPIDSPVRAQPRKRTPPSSLAKEET